MTTKVPPKRKVWNFTDSFEFLWFPFWWKIVHPFKTLLQKPSVNSNCKRQLIEKESCCNLWNAYWMKMNSVYIFYVSYWRWIKVMILPLRILCLVERRLGSASLRDRKVGVLDGSDTENKIRKRLIFDHNLFEPVWNCCCWRWNYCWVFLTNLPVNIMHAPGLVVLLSCYLGLASGGCFC